ncbi:MAG: Unknown protein [uncultured Sulfurovum sp.]|uniref:Addiction module toxin RelE n=1 Tax=uncultured Sulfurovum sp. TaxID=269237 RepID=A0A6S6SL30_9BACT|nr:MAG: Unknown protein [uncultured Sulfurovum sp.]
MNLKLIATPEFKKSVKKLAKRYKQISKDLKTLEEELNQENPTAVDFGNNCFKIRLQNSSVPTGKSGGFRVIYFFRQEENIYLLDMYSKSDLDNIEEKRLIEILVSNGLE